jgi:type IV pilus assembly protein PilM
MSNQGRIRIKTPAQAPMDRVLMAKRSHNLIGLDIDSSAVTAAEVAVDGHISIRRAATCALEDGIVRDGEITDVDGLADALRALWKANKGLPKRVRVGLASQKIVVRVMELPPLADPKELETAIRFHAQDHVPMALDQAVLDFQPLDVVDTGAGPRQRVLLVAARREMVDRMLAAVRAAGLRPEGVDLSAFAMIRALHRPDVSDGGAVLYLSIGGLTNMAVAQGATCLYTRTSSRGLEGVAIELAERQRLTLEHARGWLAHVGLEQPVEHVEGDPEIVAEARRVLLEGGRRIAADIQSNLDFHRTMDGGAPVQSAVLTGPAASIPGFAAALSAQLGLPVETRTVAGTPHGLEPERTAIAAGLAVAEVPA